MSDATKTDVPPSGQDRVGSQDPGADAGGSRSAVRIRYADLGVLSVAVIWGSSYVVMQEVTATGLSVPLFLALRFLIAAVPLLLLIGPRLRGLSWAEVRYGLIYGALLFAILALETTGVQYTTAANAGFLITVSVIIVPVFERILGGLRRPALLYLMTVVALVGCAMLSLGHSDLQPRPGDLIILAAALIRAYQIYSFGKVATRHKVDTARVTLVEVVFVAFVGLFMAPFLDPAPFSQVAAIEPWTWLLIAYLGVAGTSYAFGIQLYAVRVSSPTRVAIIMSTEPVFAAAFAMALANERLGLFQFVGGALIVVAAFVGRLVAQESRWHRRKKRKSRSCSCTTLGDPPPASNVSRKHCRSG